MFLNNKRIPVIQILKRKQTNSTSLFAELCSLINNLKKLSSIFLKRTARVFSSMSFISDDIATINRDLDPNRAHGRDMISIRMLKICEESISKSLGIILKSCIGKGQFPDEWKMWFQFIEYVISKCEETADMFHYFQYVEKYNKLHI